MTTFQEEVCNTRNWIIKHLERKGVPPGERDDIANDIITFTLEREKYYDSGKSGIFSFVTASMQAYYQKWWRYKNAFNRDSEEVSAESIEYMLCARSDVDSSVLLDEILKDTLIKECTLRALYQLNLKKGCGKLPPSATVVAITPIMKDLLVGRIEGLSVMTVLSSKDYKYGDNYLQNLFSIFIKILNKYVSRE